MRLLRRVHLWLGVFAAPTILFFALTGVIQVFGWHDGGAAGWVVRLTQVHRVQSAALPPARPRPPAARPDDNLGVDRAAARAQPPARTPIHRSRPLIWFFALVSLVMMASTASGLAIAWSFRKQRRWVLLTLGAGVVTPALLLWW
ncbi:MAG: hypothetical protein R3B06_01635 [Kofleriaceae bacterium]